MRYKFILLCICIQILSIASVFSQVWDGTSADTDWYIGHEADASYTIYTADELAGLSWLVKEGGVDFAGKTINIGNPGDDLVIDLGGNTWTPIGYWTSSSSIRPFRGSVNGNNCTIKNFRTSGSYRGLFGYVRSNTPADGDDIVIRDINVESNVSGTSYVGGICGYICGYSDGSSVYYRNAKIVNCTFNGNISASAANSYAGGIAGIAYYVTIDQCGTAGSVSGQAYVGGIAGYLRSGVSASAKRPILQNCVNSAEVKGLGIDVGGIVGYTYYANLQYNVNGGNVYGVGRYTGGIVGICANTTNIKYCLNSGSVNMGGAISGSSGSMTYCYYDTQRDTIYGIFNTEDVNNKHKGLKTTQMTVTTANTPPSDVTGAEWTTDYWSFQEGYYPIPKPLADSKFGKITSAPIFINPLENYANVTNDVALCGDATWTSSNTAYIDNAGHIVTPSGSSTLTATMNGLSKLFVVSNIDIPNPIVITTEDQLKALRDAVNGVTDNYDGYTSFSGYSGFNFQLGDNIALTEAWTPIGTETHPFCGNFDGNGHKISGLNVSTTSMQGLFGYVFNGTIKDLTVYGEIQGSSKYRGGICAYLKSDAVATWAKITNCHFIGNIVSTTSTAEIYGGGICGYATGYTKIDKCSATGSIKSSTHKNNNFAGIVGYCYGSGSATYMATITNCVNLMDIEAYSNSGGIVGRVLQYTDVANNMNAGNVSGKQANVGGIVGYCDNSKKVTIRYNVNVATIDIGSSIIGKHVATSYTVAPEHNYYNKQHSVLGGMMGADVDDNDGAVGKTTTELCGLTLTELTGFTFDSRYYPIPTAFTNEDVAVVAKAPVWLGDETFNAISPTSHTISLECPSSLTWSSSLPAIISVSGGTATIVGVYGVDTLTASMSLYYKRVKLCVAEAGDGPLTIDSYEELQDFRDAVNAGSAGQYKGHQNVNGFSGVSFLVTSDISMIDPDGNPWAPIGTSSYPFSGNFDGDNHNITDLVVSRASDYAGLFGYVTTVGRNASIIENIKLSADMSNSKSYTGGIIGYATALSTAPFTIQNCHFNGTLITTTSSGSYVGGICGYIKTYCYIKNCTSAGDIHSAGASNVGGICGYSAGNATTKNEISGCASIATNLRGVDVVGGIVGYVDNTDVKYNINAAVVNATNSVVGGIAGNVLAGASLTECFNFITTSSIGKIYGTNAGTVTDCYYDSKHCVLGEDNGTAKTTAEMKALSLNGENWSTNASRYPIPINIVSCPAAIVAASPVTLSGTEDNRHVTADFNVYTPTDLDLVWTSDEEEGFITIDAPDVTVNQPFSSVTLTATLNGLSKNVLLSNVDYVQELTIENQTDLENFRNAVNNGSEGRYKSVNNVDGFSGITFKLEPENGTDISIISVTNWTPIGSAATTPFKGNFDGQGYAISGVKTTSGTGRGLFGYVENATIENLNVTSGSGTIVASTLAGGIAGRAIKSTISNCSFNGNVRTTSSYAGGIVGRIEGSTIENCVTAGTVSSENYGGGICGSMIKNGDESRIENCASNMDILGNSSIGGITGYSSNSTVTNCINAGNVSGTTNNVGGIVGYVTDEDAVVSYCLNVGTAAGGAVVGFKNPASTVSNNYFDNQWNVDIDGIAEVGEEGDPSNEGTTSRTTQGIIDAGAFAAAWNAVSGRYPVPTAIKDLPATILASIPVKLGSQQYNLVTSNFNVGTLTDLTWTSSNTSYVTISSGTATVLGNIDDYASSILTATYNGWKKKVKVFRPNPANPLPIPDVAKLKEFRNAVNAGATGSYMGVPNINGFVGKNFALTSTEDTYDLNDEGWTPIGSSSTCAFKGNFDGNGKTITGLKITSTSSYRGLFGYVNRGSIRNLNVVGSVSGKDYVGGICGYIKGGNSDNFSRISHCTFNGNVTATTTSATTYAGGIVGSNNSYTSITQCCVAGAITATATTNTYVGGITGLSSGASADKDSIASCTNAAVVSGSGDYVGGIAGGIKNTYIDYCNNGGNVSGVRHYTGGITGSNPSTAAVRYCMSSSLVVEGGAIIGINGGTATANFYDKQRTSVKGIAATDGTSADQSGKAVGLFTTEMTGGSPSGLTGDGWIPARWTYAENLYPIPAALGSNNFTVITSTPIFIDKASATPANWNSVKPVNTLELGGPAEIVWTSDNNGYINVSVDPIVIEHPLDFNSATLTSALNGVSKKYILEDYGDLSSLDIYTLAELKEFRDAVNDRESGSYKGVLNIGGYAGFTINLLDNITIDETNWVPIGKAADCNFAGTFEGNNHTISNLKITNKQYAGLFGYIKYGSVRDLNLNNVTISNNASYTGAVCGYIEGKATNDKSAISSCKVLSGTIKSTTSNSYLGGIVGAMGTNACISDCENSATITSRNLSGGICGSVSAGSNGSIDVISDCVNYGSVTSSASYNKVGGIVGNVLMAGNVVGCVNRGNVKAGYYVGGIAGYMYGSNDNSRKATMTLCVNDATVDAISTSNASNVGGIVGYLGTFAKVDKGLNSGNVSGKKNYVGGVVGRSVATLPTKKNQILYSTNSADVTGSENYVAGICGKDTITEIKYCLNGGNVNGTTSTNIGGISGYNCENSIVAYNISTGTVETSDSTNGICGTNEGTTENNYYDRQRSLCAVDNTDGLITDLLSGTGRSAFSDGDWSSNFVFNDNMYPMPLGTDTYSEAKLAATPVYLHFDDASNYEVYDSVSSSITLVDAYTSWTSNDDDHITISGTTATITYPCDLFANDTLVASLNVDESLTLKKNVKVNLAYVKTPELESISDVNLCPNTEQTISVTVTNGVADCVYTWTPNVTDESSVEVSLLRSQEYHVVVANSANTSCSSEVVANVNVYTPEVEPDEDTYIWYGRTINDWNTATNWMLYESGEDSYSMAGDVPESSNNVIITKFGTEGCVVTPELNDDATINNFKAGSNVELDIATSNHLTINGNATIDGAIIGDVIFGDAATCADVSSGYIDGIITKTGASDNFRFLTGHFDSDRGLLLRSAFGMSVEGDDAEVSVHYTTNHDTYSMPDSYSHGGNMGGDLDHVSDRDFWHVSTNKPLSNVSLHWRNRESISLSGDCVLDFMRVAYVTGGSSVWAEMSGSIDGDCETGSITVTSLGGSRAIGQEYDLTLGSTDSGDKLVLPIELVSFTAFCDGNSVDVKWTTASEKNNDYFILERSYDAVNFSEITRITGAGNSIEENNYAYTDYEYYGGEMYYRLQQVDYDGKRSASEIIVVKCSDEELEPAIAVFPNPFRSELTLSLSNFANKPATIEIFDIMGTLVMSKDIDATGNNYETVLNLGNLSAATYTIRVSTADFVINRRVVKQ